MNWKHMDRDRLSKLMAMTTSDNDNEALAALRMANKMLSSDKVTWGEVLAAGGPVINIALRRPQPSAYEPGTPVREDWVAPHLKDKVMIDLMFRAVYAQPRSSNEEFWQFMDSIHNRWTKHGNLTQGQYSALRNCYKRVVRTNA